MRRNAVVAIIGAVALGGVVWWTTSRAREPQPLQIANAQQVEPGKTAQASRGKGKGRGGAIAVEAAAARGATTTTDIRAIGSIRSDESVQIASEISGRVAEISFVEGGFVKAGSLLVKLDNALAQAEVADAKARYDLAKSNNDRAKQLSRSGNVTEKAIDEAAAGFETARAALELREQTGVPVHLALWVKVRENWADSDADLQALGFDPV
jgi:membrane fusion protein (multidrug efflux system)